MGRFRPSFQFGCGASVCGINKTLERNAVVTMKEFSRRSLTSVAGLAIGLFTLTGCGKEEKAATEQQSPPPEVTVAKMVPRTIPLKYTFLGQLKDSGRVEIRARVQGFLQKTLFDNGTTVSKGDVLYVIDPSEFLADVEFSRAQISQAEAALKLASIELLRAKELVASNALAQRDLDKAIANEQTQRGNLRLAKANLVKSELDLSYTTITAPLSGKFGKSAKDPGSLVDSGSNSYLNEIIATDPITVGFTISERELLSSRKDVTDGRLFVPERGDLKVQIELLDGTLYPLLGHMSFFDIRIAEDTGTAAVEAKIPNPGTRLQVGQFVKAHLLGIMRPNALTVPQESVIQTGTGAQVFIVDKDGKVEARPVVASAWEGRQWMVDKGLSPGDQVVVEGIQRIRPGMTVKIAATTTADDAATSGPKN